jgi:hypothetical protein
VRKKDYIQNLDVLPFLTFLKEYVDGKSHPHHYRNYRKRRQWECTSLLDAAKRYEWPIDRPLCEAFLPKADGELRDDFAANSIVLQELQKRLRDAFHRQDNVALADVANHVFTWGGTVNGNPARLQALNEKDGLTKYFRRCEKRVGRREPAGAAYNTRAVTRS